MVAERKAHGGFEAGIGETVGLGAEGSEAPDAEGGNRRKLHVEVVEEQETIADVEVGKTVGLAFDEVVEGLNRGVGVEQGQLLPGIKVSHVGLDVEKMPVPREVEPVADGEPRGEVLPHGAERAGCAQGEIGAKTKGLGSVGWAAGGREQRQFVAHLLLEGGKVGGVAAVLRATAEAGYTGVESVSGCVEHVVERLWVVGSVEGALQGAAFHFEHVEYHLVVAQQFRCAMVGGDP